jgi:hypothetical protein
VSYYNLSEDILLQLVGRVKRSQRTKKSKCKNQNAKPGNGELRPFRPLPGFNYLHDGRCLTLEDTVEFFNLVQGLKLDKEMEKADLVAFLRQL